jgi:acetolactate synthase-1/2/3 large subunit
MRPEELPKVLARAFSVFDSARPGPVHIEIPLDVITAPAHELTPRPWPRTAAPAVSRDGLQQLAGRLGAARHPCLLVGGGAVGAAAEVLTLAERLGAPIVSTVNGKGIAPRGHWLAVGGSPSVASVRALLAESDCVLAIGTEFGETDYDMLFLGEMPPFQWLARIDIDPAQLCRNVRANLPLCGAAAPSLRSLLDLLDESPADRAAGAERVNTARARIRNEPHFHPEIQAIFDTLQETLPELVLVGDSTLPTYYAVWQYECSAPRVYFHSATGAGTLGYAIPAAIGAKRARSQLPVVALIGDGAAQFTFMELAAAVQEKLPIIVLLWNNHGYREIHAGMEASDVQPVGVEIDAPDFLAAARALGCLATRVRDLEALGSALRDAAAAAVPTLVELRQDDFLSLPAGAWYTTASD